MSASLRETATSTIITNLTVKNNRVARFARESFSFFIISQPFSSLPRSDLKYPVWQLCAQRIHLKRVFFFVILGRLQGRLPFTRNAWKFWLENEMVHTIPFETFQKLETTSLISAFFLFFVNFLIDSSTFCDISVLRLDKLQH